MYNMGMDDLKNRELMSRREFLKDAAFAAAATVLNPEIGTSPEKELKSQVVVIDFFGLKSGATEEEIKRRVHKDDEDAKVAIMGLFVHDRQGHGEQVVGGVLKTREYLGHTGGTNVDKVSIGQKLSSGEVKRDRLGNIRMKLTLDEVGVAELVSGTHAGVVNMSFEFGGEARYRFMGERDKYPEAPDRVVSNQGIVGGDKKHFDAQGNEVSEQRYREIARLEEEREPILLPVEERRIDFVDGYIGPDKVDNLAKMGRLARKFPEKLFVVAAGNPSFVDDRGWVVPDISVAKKQLEEQGLWSDNILVVGVEGREYTFKGPLARGADIYVTYDDLKALGLSQASSFATPVISEVGQELVIHGFDTPEKVKEQLYRACEQKDFGRVFDLARMKEQMATY